MRKFDDIKVGDVVFINKQIVTGWHSVKTFTIPVKVERVTPTQFVAGGNRYKKDYGFLIGDCGACYRLGDSVYGREVKDQTEEMNTFVKKFELCEKLKNLIYKINNKQADDYLNFDESSIEKTVEALTQLEEIGS